MTILSLWIFSFFIEPLDIDNMGRRSVRLRARLLKMCASLGPDNLAVKSLTFRTVARGSTSVVHLRAMAATVVVYSGIYFEDIARIFGLPVYV